MSARSGKILGLYGRRHARARPLTGGLNVVPTYDFADVTSGVARKPDLVVVPAVNDPTGEQESRLRAWIAQQAHTGARILGICAGSRVLAATGLHDGHTATPHWSRIAPLRKSNPRVNWVEGQRYVDDGTITISAGARQASRPHYTSCERSPARRRRPRSHSGFGTRVGRQAPLPQSQSSTSPAVTPESD